MRLIYWLSIVLFLWVPFSANASSVAQVPAGDETVTPACAQSAISRFVRHKITAGETLESIAQRYRLIPATLMGLNPVLRSGKASVGSVIQVPPYNGIRVELKPKQTLRDLAKTYGIRPGVLFEANGCQTAPKVVFVPGVNWSPVAANVQDNPVPLRILSGYPLLSKPSKSAILLNYGWGLQSSTGQVAFHSGVDLAAPLGTSVLAAADGTIAFAGNQGAYGKLVVINHQEGLQTRYAQLASINVKAGQTVKRGQAIATVGTSGRPSSTEPHLHFEVRSRSGLGWVAEDPESYLLQNLQRPTQAKNESAP